MTQAKQHPQSQVPSYRPGVFESISRSIAALAGTVETTTSMVNKFAQAGDIMADSAIILAEGQRQVVRTKSAINVQIKEKELEAMKDEYQL